MTGFSIESLTSAHARQDFSSGVAVLDRYLTDLASQDVKRRVSNCFVALDPEGIIAGYYTLSAATVPLGDLRPEETKKLPRYPSLPAGLIGRLAIDLRFQGKRLGSAMVMDAVSRCVRSDPAIFALIVDAKDEKAVGFYEHLGFRRCVSRPMSLYLPIATLMHALESRT